MHYLDRSNRDPAVRNSKDAVIGALELRPGDHVIDVGCGLGHMTLKLANRLKDAGHVMGVDSSRVLITEARKRVRREDGCPLDFQVGDAHRLGFFDNSFDASLIINLLIHVRHPLRVLSEAFRVMKPGGRIAIMESDWQLAAFATGNLTTDKMLTSLLRRAVRNSGVAHQLPTLMRLVGFTNILPKAGTLTTYNYQEANQAWRIHDNIEQRRKVNALSNREVRAILKAITTAVHNGMFFGTSVGFFVAGRKPIAHDT